MSDDQGDGETPESNAAGASEINNGQNDPLRFSLIHRITTVTTGAQQAEWPNPASAKKMLAWKTVPAMDMRPAPKPRNVTKTVSRVLTLDLSAMSPITGALRVQTKK
jgi:hypothetical protein